MSVTGPVTLTGTSVSVNSGSWTFSGNIYANDGSTVQVGPIADGLGYSPLASAYVNYPAPNPPSGYYYLKCQVFMEYSLNTNKGVTTGYANFGTDTGYNYGAINDSSEPTTSTVFSSAILHFQQAAGSPGYRSLVEFNNTSTKNSVIIQVDYVNVELYYSEASAANVSIAITATADATTAINHSAAADVSCAVTTTGDATLYAGGGGTLYDGAANVSVDITTTGDASLEANAAATADIVVTTTGTAIAGTFHLAAANVSMSVTTSGLAYLSPSPDSALTALQSGWAFSALPPLYIGPTRRDFFIPYSSLSLRYRRAEAYAGITVSCSGTPTLYHSTLSAGLSGSAAMTSALSADVALKATALAGSSSVAGSLDKLTANLSGGAAMTSSLTGGAEANLIPGQTLSGQATLFAHMLTFNMNLSASLAGGSIAHGMLRTGDQFNATLAGNAGITARLDTFQLISANLSATSIVHGNIPARPRPLTGRAAGQSALGANLLTGIPLQASMTGQSSIQAIFRRAQDAGSVQASGQATLTASLTASIRPASRLSARSSLTAVLGDQTRHSLSASLHGNSQTAAVLTAYQHISANLSATSIVHGKIPTRWTPGIVTTSKDEPLWVR